MQGAAWHDESMHEFGIASGLLDSVVAAADKNGAKSVESIRLRIGRLSGVVFESLEFAFQALSEGTKAQGAKLVVEEIPVTCFCTPCNKLFESASVSYRCPDCGAISRDLRRGREMEIVSIEVN